MLNRLICILFKGHTWHNDKGFPVHGYRDEPNDGSVCTRCGRVVHWREGK